MTIEYFVAMRYMFKHDFYCFAIESDRSILIGDSHRFTRKIQYTHLMPAPVDQTSASAWLSKHP